MPSYDAECAACGYEAIALIKLAELDAWDKSALCPECGGDASSYRRVIKNAPFGRVGGEGSARAEAARKKSAKAAFRRSGARDGMLQKANARVDQNQVAAARESAAKGE